MNKDSPKPIKAHCPNCDGERLCDVHGSVDKSWYWEDPRHGDSMNGSVKHSLLECRGCETVFYETRSWNSEDVHPYYDHEGDTQYDVHETTATHPKPDSNTTPKWLNAMQRVDYQLQNILRQMYVANDSGARILTAIGLRTALDRATEVLGIEAALTFDEKLDALRDGDWIGGTERDILGVVTDAGNAAAHRGWEPNRDEISQLLMALEAFLHRAFIVGQGALKIREGIPEKPKRRPRPKQKQLPPPTPSPTG